MAEAAEYHQKAIAGVSVEPRGVSAGKCLRLRLYNAQKLIRCAIAEGPVVVHFGCVH